jgi:hypothetical protein
MMESKSVINVVGVGTLLSITILDDGTAVDLGGGVLE